MFSRVSERDVFAAAEERVRLCQSREFRAQGESLLHGADDFSVTRASGKKSSRGREAAGRGVASDLTFDNRKVQARDPCGLASAVDTRLGGLLKFGHFDQAIRDTASQCTGQLKVRNEMISASQVIALYFADTLVVRDLNRPQAVLPKCGDRPSAREVGRASAAESELHCFRQFLRKRCQREGETTKFREGRLFADAQDLRILFAQVSGHCQKERAGSGDDHTFPVHGQTGFHQRLEPSCA
jgi:hypothetical protein